MAREVAAIYGTKVSMPRGWSSQQSGENPGREGRASTTTPTAPATRPSGPGTSSIGPSPRWMQNRLRAVGSRPINNVVDITNYVMLELGQPMHAFDQSKLSGTTITIERAAAGTKVVTLDDQERELDEDTLLVCDENGPIALAGVMGLANSEVGESTKDILLESAFFDPHLVRRQPRAGSDQREQLLPLRARRRLGHGRRPPTAPCTCSRNCRRPHRLRTGPTGSDPDYKPARAMPLRIWQVNRLLGTEITTDEAAQILQALGLKVQPMGNPESSNASAVNMMVKVPSFRRDLLQEVDLIEEIARMPRLRQHEGWRRFRGRPAAAQAPSGSDVVLASARGGLPPTVTTRWSPASFLAATGIWRSWAWPRVTCVADPVGDQSQPRRRHPAAHQPAAFAAGRGAPQSELRGRLPVRLFQINRTFLPGGRQGDDPRHEDEKLLPEEPLFLQFAVAGAQGYRGLDGVPADLLELKGVVETLGNDLRLPLSLRSNDREVWLAAGCPVADR